jgi:ubiquinone/menaquinone biosynthesis C-methylase UbiE
MSTDSSATAPTSGASHQAKDYALGSSDRERRRLMLQGKILRPYLASAFRAAGLAPGMRVLDLGCGVGDVSMLAAEFVGPTGSVVGLDRDADSVAWATKRIADAGLANIRFQVAEFGQFTDAQPFDAIVGRFILMYLPDPTATLKHLMHVLRSGSVIVFMEPDFTVPSRSFPEVQQPQKGWAWFGEAFRRSGACIDMGMRLYSTYRDAGYVKTSTEVSHLSGCGYDPEMVEYFVETFRSILPRVIQFGIATAEEVQELQIDTLAERIEAVSRAADAQWVGSRCISAWARKP